MIWCCFFNLALFHMSMGCPIMCPPPLVSLILDQSFDYSLNILVSKEDLRYATRNTRTEGLKIIAMVSAILFFWPKRKEHQVD